jgi:hypothetical protein
VQRKKDLKSETDTKMASRAKVVAV